MLVLLLSPVPMVRGFARAAGRRPRARAALRAHRRRGRARARSGGAARARSRAWRGRALARPLGRRRSRRRLARARGELLRDNALTRLSRRVALGRAVRRPERVLAIGLALAALGLGRSTRRRSVETDITKLVPQNLASLRRRSTRSSAPPGVGGEIDVMVSGRNVATPATIEWMSAYQAAVLRALRLQRRARLRAGAAVPGLLAARPLPAARVAGSAGAPASKLTAAEVERPARRDPGRTSPRT